MKPTCADCNIPLSKGVYEFSINNFGIALCMPHQKGKTKVVESRDEKVSNLLRATPEALRVKTGLVDKGWVVIHEDKDEHKHVDLAVKEAKIVIEVDGVQHNQNSKQGISDIKRTFHDFVDKDVITIRIPNSVMNDNETIDEVIEVLDNLLRERCRKLENEMERVKYAKIGKVAAFAGYIFFIYSILDYFNLL